MTQNSLKWILDTNTDDILKFLTPPPKMTNVIFFYFFFNEGFPKVSVESNPSQIYVKSFFAHSRECACIYSLRICCTDGVSFNIHNKKKKEIMI